MTTPPLVVLKFGGSVLRDEASLVAAVHEIYRWWRDGWRVASVVSALAGRTDELLARADRLGLAPDSHARAGMAAAGERECAALLAALLERAGVPSACLPSGILARGRADDASPCGARTGPVRRALERLGVVVCPGFEARDARGETVLLGRGGSDLSAMGLACALRASRCILIKDVDGLYDRDPAKPGPPARRYRRASWQDALETDGSIVQHKAVRFARRHGLVFELGALNATDRTIVGGNEHVLAAAPAPQPPLRVAVLGHGTVGAGVARLVADDPARFTLVGVASLSPARHAAPAPVSDDALALACGEADVVVEAMGGLEAAAEAVTAALRRGKAVVTANKDLLAARGPELAALAARHGGRLLGGAAVGGALPVLEAVTRPAAAPVVALTGVLNGTANFVLGRMDAGHQLEDALSEARRRGFAEADPSRDLDGRDAAAKLCAIALACGTALSMDDVRRDPVLAASWRRGVRQVASLARDGSGWKAAIELARPPAASPLLQARGEQNVVVIRRADGSEETLHGAGAGRWPTAEAVLGDLWQLSREGATSAPGPASGPGAQRFNWQTGQKALTTPSAARPVEASLS